ncbi:unnamed protein product [[Actinomadura] parvosata subsp. kistnae]|nr:unnamed protein product [Actinomadura parvosata subsp. kistnae]
MPRHVPPVGPSWGTRASVTWTSAGRSSGWSPRHRPVTKSGVCTVVPATPKTSCRNDQRDSRYVLCPLYQRFTHALWQ